MKYLAIFLCCNALGLFIASSLVEAKLVECVADAKRFSAHSGIDTYTDELLQSARRTKIEYGIAAGSVLGVLLSALVWLWPNV